MTDLAAAVTYEWTKARTVRSTLGTLLLALVLGVTVALLFGFVLRGAYDDMSEQGRATFDPVRSGFNGLRLSMIALVVFGVLQVAGEYASGAIAGSLAAVPRRGVLYAAKLITTTLVALTTSVVVVLATFVTAQAAIGGEHNASVTDDGVPRVLLGAVAYLTLLCVFSFGVAAMLRSPVVALAVLVPLFFMISEILNNLPGVRAVAQFLPDVAGDVLLRRRPPDDTVLSAGTALGVLLLWTAVATAGGFLAVRRRDV
jgi:ABC-2 type transport system permease protein